MAVIPEGATDMLQRNSEIDPADQYGFAAIEPAPLHINDSKTNLGGGGVSPRSAAPSPSLGSTPTNTLTQRRLSLRKSKSVSLPPPPKLKYKYMNYWTGEIFDDEPQYSADAGLLYTSAPPSPSSSVSKDKRTPTQSEE